MYAPCLLALAAAFPAGVGILPEPIPQDEPAESELDRLLKATRSSRLVVRPQAARRIVRRFEDADEAGRAVIVERLRAEAGETSESLASLSTALIEVLGSFEDEVLRQRLWSALGDPDFPWRPYAARALVTGAVPAEAPEFRALLEDPIAPVRAAVIEALAALEDPSPADAVISRLDDPDGTVRRTAAECLVGWGRNEALWWLVEEAQREDTFFDRPSGELARYDATRRLSKLLARELERSGIGTDAGEAYRALLVDLVTQRAGDRPDLSSIASSFEGPHGREVLGLEIRSCRRGEYFLRWTADDELWVGEGNPARLELEAGTTERLRAAALRAGEATPARFTGTPGCDMEQLLVRGNDGASLIWIVSKGPDAVEDLRPEPITELFQTLLLGSLPAGSSEDPRLDELRGRVSEALRSVGG